MPNIFKSKDVYKHVIKPGNQHELIPVRGVYVANVYRPPYCIDFNIELKDIPYHSAEVVRYTMSDVDVYGIEIPNPKVEVENNPITIIDYVATLQDTYSMEMVNTMEIENDTIDIVYYTKASEDTYDDICECVFEIDNGSGIEITTVTTAFDSEIDTTIQLVGISSNQATIVR